MVTNDPELERIFQEIKRLNNGIAALEERVFRYLASRMERSETLSR
jgi:hypothetical protein